MQLQSFFFTNHAKSHGGAGGRGAGLTGLLNNYEAFQRWVKKTHQRSLYVDASFSMAGLRNEYTDEKQAKHRDLRPAEIVKSEKAVQRTMEAVTNFIYPFGVDVKDITG